ncbi:MAG: fumarylacetoacetate hydrolase family protein [Flavobacteriaceae bacterium]
MKIVCIGRNYAKHIEELANERPSDPVVFIKPDTAVLSKQAPFVIPEYSKDVHYELEVMVKITKVGKYIQKEFAHKYYQQVGLGIDFTARDIQQQCKNKGLPWEKAKAFDGSAKIGQWVDKTKFKDLDALKFQMLKNGEVVQDGDTAQMLWKIDELIAYVSQFFTLKIGDVLMTGTPAGVGPVAIGDEFVGTLEGEENLRLRIR